MEGLSFGESKLKVNDATEDARSVNRRVEKKVVLEKIVIRPLVPLLNIILRGI
jgi:hypothetical protein